MEVTDENSRGLDAVLSERVTRPAKLPQADRGELDPPEHGHDKEKRRHHGTLYAMNQEIPSLAAHVNGELWATNAEVPLGSM